MTCPRCHSEFENPHGVCPECGVRLLRNVSGVMKTSAVMISAQGEQGFYRSVHDVPEPLRTQLIETTTSSNSGIIVIADRAGKEQLTQVMARREAKGIETQPGDKNPDETPVPHATGLSRLALSRLALSPFALSRFALSSFALSRFARRPWLPWGGFVLVLMLAAILFAVFQTDWATFSFHWSARF